ncbi:MAG: hypothetical protein VW270_25830 [Candidatus Poseidoniales archaeon]
MNKDELIDALKYQIALERKLIERERAAQERMRTQNSGVRSGSISADLAAYDLICMNAQDRIAEHEKKIEELENEN